MSGGEKRPLPSDDSTAQGSPPTSKPRIDETAQLYTVDDLIRARAEDADLKDKPLVFYPSFGTDYVGHTAAELYELSNRAASYYNAFVPQRISSTEKPTTVALLGPSTFDYLIALLALSKLGHSVLLLSTRISEEAHVALLTRCEASCVFADGQFHELAQNVQKQVSGLKTVQKIAGIENYAHKSGSTSSEFSSSLRPEVETNNVAWIIHSSGSTSLPKPVPQTHAAALGNFKSQFNLVGFVTLPLYHMQGLGCVFRSIMNKKPAYMYNASLPLTSKHLIATLKAHPEIQILYGVPYVLKLLADSEEGIEACRNLEVLFSGGASTPKSVGDKLVQAGVNLVSHLGTSETGQLMTSFRSKEEILEWDYLRPSDAVQPFLRWEPYDSEGGVFELVVLDGWPSKSVTNREDGSYATGDLWERHPNKNAWRYYARKDDTLVLVNGEKANPLLFEGLVRESRLVDEAIVFGAEKPHLGIFIVAKDPAIERDALVEEIWPAVEKGNATMPAHAQLSKDMIQILPADDAARIRKTDKSTVIRAAFYKEFASSINDAYDDQKGSGLLQLDEQALKDFLRSHLETMISPAHRSHIFEDEDLFSLGMDSLRSSQLRSIVVKNIDTGTAVLPENFVFDFPSVEAMSSELLRMRAGITASEAPPVEDLMQDLIDEYSFDLPQPIDRSQADKHCVVLTGVTGSLGVHLLPLVGGNPVCLVRASSDVEAAERVYKSIRDRGLDTVIPGMRFTAYAADFTQPRLGLADHVYEQLCDSVSLIIHCAWTVNFNLGLESFEDCIMGTRHLIDLALHTRVFVDDQEGGTRPCMSSFVFCSSISAAGASSEAIVPEDFSAALTDAQPSGYAQSKLVAERICQAAGNAVEDFPVAVMRIGQIAGDTTKGIWNLNEAVPMIVKSAKTVGALPRLNEQCSWMPVNAVARVVSAVGDDLELFDDHTPRMFHVVNPNTFSWSLDFLPMLRTAGVEFEEVEPQEWLRLLRAKPDPLSNPPYKLIDFFTKKYDGSQPRKDLIFSNKLAQDPNDPFFCEATIEQSLVDKFVHYWENPEATLHLVKEVTVEGVRWVPASEVRHDRTLYKVTAPQI